MYFVGYCYFVGVFGVEYGEGDNRVVVEIGEGDWFFVGVGNCI